MTTEREHKARWKANHIKALESLGFKPSQFNCLRQLENEAHRFAESYCNGHIEGEDYERFCVFIESKIANLLGGNMPKGFFINGDPRGYALKIDAGMDAGEEPHPEYIPEGMHTDWGGYGIIAPEF